MNKDMLLEELKTIEKQIQMAESYKYKNDNPSIESQQNKDEEIKSFLKVKDTIKNRIAEFNNLLSNDSNYEISKQNDLSRNNLLNDLATKKVAETNYETQIVSYGLNINNLQKEIDDSKEEVNKISSNISIYERQLSNDALSLAHREDITNKINRLKSDLNQEKDKITRRTILLENNKKYVSNITSSLNDVKKAIKEVNEEIQILDDQIAAGMGKESDQSKENIEEKERLQSVLDAMNAKEIMEYKDHKEVIESLIKGIEDNLLTDEEIKLKIEDLKEIVKYGTLEKTIRSIAYYESELVQMKLPNSVKLLTNKDIVDEIQAVNTIDYEIEDYKRKEAEYDENLAVNNLNILRIKNKLAKAKNELYRANLEILSPYLADEDIAQLREKINDCRTQIPIYEQEIKEYEVKNSNIMAQKDEAKKSSDIEALQEKREEKLKKLTILKKEINNKKEPDTTIPLIETYITLLKEREALLRDNVFDRIDKIVEGKDLPAKNDDDMNPISLGKVDDASQKPISYGDPNLNIDDIIYGLNNANIDFNNNTSNNSSNGESSNNESSIDEDSNNKPLRCKFIDPVIEIKNNIKEKLKTNKFKSAFNKFKILLPAAIIALSGIKGSGIEKAYENANQSIITNESNIDQTTMPNNNNDNNSTQTPVETQTHEVSSDKNSDKKQNEINVVPIETQKPTVQSESIIDKKEDNESSKLETPNEQTLEETQKPSTPKPEVSENPGTTKPEISENPSTPEPNKNESSNVIIEDAIENSEEPSIEPNYSDVTIEDATDEPIVSPIPSENPTQSPTISYEDEPTISPNEGPSGSDKDTTKIEIFDGEQLIIPDENGNNYSQDNSNNAYSSIVGETNPIEENSSVISKEEQEDKTTIIIEKDQSQSEVKENNNSTSDINPSQENIYKDVTVEDEIISDNSNENLNQQSKAKEFNDVVGETKPAEDYSYNNGKTLDDYKESVIDQNEYDKIYDIIFEEDGMDKSNGKTK